MAGFLACRPPPAIAWGHMASMIQPFDDSAPEWGASVSVTPSGAHPATDPEPPTEYTGPGDWGRQGSWGTFSNRLAWSDRE